MKSNNIKKTKDDMIFDIINTFIISVVVLIIIYPLYFVIIASFTDPKYIFSGDLWLFPLGFNIEGYKELFKYSKIWIGYRNTICYTVIATIINLVLTIPAGYVLSRKDLYGRNIIMMYLTITMFFSGGLIPLFFVVKSLGLYNTFGVMVILGAVSVWNLILCRTFFSSSIPQELWEAASIDGCNNIRFLIRIVLPLSHTIIAVMALFYSVEHWNEYMNALIYLNDSNRFPLQLILRDILIVNAMDKEMVEAAIQQQGTIKRMDELLRYTSIIVASVPVMMFYPFLQRYFVKGVMIGSLKG